MRRRELDQRFESTSLKVPDNMQIMPQSFQLGNHQDQELISYWVCQGIVLKEMQKNKKNGVLSVQKVI